jgi:biotin carboxyl carrier protein
MMGSVWKVEVSVGDTIEAGVTGLILEAMKMEMIVQVMKAGTIDKILVSPGAMVKAGDPLLIIRINQL